MRPAKREAGMLPVALFDKREAPSPERTRIAKKSTFSSRETGNSVLNAEKEKTKGARELSLKEKPFQTSNQPKKNPL